jgi:hypothetical protein
LLKKLGIGEDFTASGAIRYTHRSADNKEIYFISNRTESQVKDVCSFRVSTGIPELWDPLTGESRRLPEYNRENGLTFIPMSFEKYQSFFVVFDKSESNKSFGTSASYSVNFPEIQETKMLDGSWEVSFDPAWGGPEKITFDQLTDWSTHANEGIRYYSGKATYYKTFDLPKGIHRDNTLDIYLDLGEVKNIARVILNGKNLGVIWTSPWRVNITDCLKTNVNKLEIEVANLWGNRLIGDERLPDDGVKDGKWPDWLIKNQPRTSGRYTFVPRRFYDKEEPLQTSGLLGPVTVCFMPKMNK